MSDAVERSRPVCVGRIDRDARWPSFRTMAATLGVTGVVACSLTIRRGQGWETVGA